MLLEFLVSRVKFIFGGFMEEVGFELDLDEWVDFER